MSGSTPDSISAIIPTRDRWHVLPTAIESVLQQSLPVGELIVVDDGSIDGTAERIKSAYPSVIVHQQQSMGVSNARNAGMRLATGSWLAFLDSDDLWYPTKLEQQMQALDAAPECRLCHCDEHWFRDGRRVNPKTRHRKMGGQIFSHCLPLCAISPSAALIHRTLFDDVGVWDESLPACEDYDLWLRISAREPVAFVDKPLLAKTGGHEDQLSKRYPAMDRFRLVALAKLLRSGTLDVGQRLEAQAQFQRKHRIYRSGALKRGRTSEIERFEHEHADLL